MLESIYYESLVDETPSFYELCDAVTQQSTNTRVNGLGLGTSLKVNKLLYNKFQSIWSP
jgi:hypothetical protein